MNEKKSFWLTSKGPVAACAILFLTYLLLVEYQQHFVAWLSYLILLLCPLMHLFMHKGHHEHGDSNNIYKKGYDET